MDLLVMVQHRFLMQALDTRIADNLILVRKFHHSRGINYFKWRQKKESINENGRTYHLLPVKSIEYPFYFLQMQSLVIHRLLNLQKFIFIYPYHHYICQKFYFFLIIPHVLVHLHIREHFTYRLKFKLRLSIVSRRFSKIIIIQ